MHVVDSPTTASGLTSIRKSDLGQRWRRRQDRWRFFSWQHRSKQRHRDQCHADRFNWEFGQRCLHPARPSNSVIGNTISGTSGSVCCDLRKPGGSVGLRRWNADQQRRRQRRAEQPSPATCSAASAWMVSRTQRWGRPRKQHHGQRPQRRRDLWRSDGEPIAFNAINSNTGNGVLISGAGNVGNRVQSNSFINNTALAIDLGGDGVTPNDTLDADTGPNNLQNSPVIPAASSIAVDVTLHSTPTTTFLIQLYESITACSASGQGNTLVAAFNVVTNASVATHSSRRVDWRSRSETTQRPRRPIRQGTHRSSRPARWCSRQLIRRRGISPRRRKPALRRFEIRFSIDAPRAARQVRLRSHVCPGSEGTVTQCRTSIARGRGPTALCGAGLTDEPSK